MPSRLRSKSKSESWDRADMLCSLHKVFYGSLADIDEIITIETADCRG